MKKILTVLFFSLISVHIVPVPMCNAVPVCNGQNETDNLCCDSDWCASGLNTHRSCPRV